MKSWEEKVKDYCEKYNIPAFYLAETLYEPKVVPMSGTPNFRHDLRIEFKEV